MRPCQTSTIGYYTDIGCDSNSDCSGDELCFDDECIDLDDFYSTYDGCCSEGVNVSIDGEMIPECDLVEEWGEINNCSEITCDNCENGFLECINFLEDDIFVSYCGECTSDSDCNEDYDCENNLCVSE